MALGNLGLSFAPFADDEAIRKKRRAGHPVQEAIRMLSFRMPRFLGAGSIAPAALLQSQGGIGLPTPNPSVAALLQQVFGQGAPPMGAGGGPMGGGSMGGGMPGMPGAGVSLLPPMPPGGFGAAPLPQITPGAQPPPTGPVRPPQIIPDVPGQSIPWPSGQEDLSWRRPGRPGMGTFGA